MSKAKEELRDYILDLLINPLPPYQWNVDEVVNKIESIYSTSTPPDAGKGKEEIEGIFAIESGHLIEIGKHQVDYKRQVAIVGKKEADSVLYFWMEGFEYAKKIQGLYEQTLRAVKTNGGEIEEG